MTGTSLFPSSFGINYEFVDTELGGEPYLGEQKQKPKDPQEDLTQAADPSLPILCSRVFRKRKGDFQSPRNVFLHGRGGAKNISCLYRFEASVGERVSRALPGRFPPLNVLQILHLLPESGPRGVV